MSEPPVLHEDDDLIAVAKRAGDLVIPGRGTSGGLTLQAMLEARLGAKIFVVHRLDQGTSGVLLFAKNAAAHKALCGQFEDKTVSKVYLALVRGDPGPEGEIDSPLREFGSGRVAVDARRGKACRTNWKRRARGAGASLLEVTPLTGRRHQIRAHLYSIGHAILGDSLYGPKEPGAPRLMLHAWKLSFNSLDSRRIDLNCEPPNEFLMLIRNSGIVLF